MAKIGVVMRTKDRPVLLKRALKSIVNQTVDDWALALVNDGGDKSSVDQLVDALPAKQRARIIRIDNSSSIGMEAASNAGLARLDSKYMMIHDDDDSLHPHFFQETTAYLDNPPHPSFKGVVTGTERVIEAIEGSSVRKVRSFAYNDWLEFVSLRRMLAENVFAPIAFLFDRKACLEVGSFREDLPVLGDWDFNIRFLRKYEIGVIGETLAYYHDREADDTSEYASSIQAKAHLHGMYDNLLRNEWLRKDIEDGTVGQGTIANFSMMLWDLAWDVKREVRKKRIRLF